MSETLFAQLIWAHYRVAVVITVGLPLVVMAWAMLKREGAIARLMDLYWKVASLLAVTVLLMAGGDPLAYATGVAAQVLILAALWFWADINEELADLPPWRPLPLTTRLWRWSMTVFALLGIGFSSTALGCMGAAEAAASSCAVWQQPPSGLSEVLGTVLRFLLGADWGEGPARFTGYLGLGAYAVGLLQWLLVRWPRYGRTAGGF